MSSALCGGRPRRHPGCRSSRCAGYPTGRPAAPSGPRRRGLSVEQVNATVARGRACRPARRCAPSGRSECRALHRIEQPCGEPTTRSGWVDPHRSDELQPVPTAAAEVVDRPSSKPTCPERDGASRLPGPTEGDGSAGNHGRWSFASLLGGRSALDARGVAEHLVEDSGTKSGLIADSEAVGGANAAQSSSTCHPRSWASATHSTGCCTPLKLDWRDTRRGCHGRVRPSSSSSHHRAIEGAVRGAPPQYVTDAPAGASTRGPLTSLLSYVRRCPARANG